MLHQTVGHVTDIFMLPAAYVWRATGVSHSVSLGPHTVHYVFTADLISMTESHGLSPHIYADDTLVYGACRSAAIDALSSKISDSDGHQLTVSGGPCSSSAT